jgi:hypothetical protein
VSLKKIKIKIKAFSNHMPIQNEFLNSIISIGFIFEVKIVLTFFLTIHFIKKKKKSFKKELQISSSIYSEQEKEIGVGVGGIGN